MRSLKKTLLLIGAVMSLLIVVETNDASNRYQEPKPADRLATTCQKLSVKSHDWRIAPYSVISLPSGLCAYMTESWNDAWIGYIESIKPPFRISYGVGTVGDAISDTEKDRFIFLKQEKTATGILQYGLKNTDAGKLLVAKIDWANFSAQYRNEQDLKLFLEIVRSFKKADGCAEGCMPAFRIEKKS